MSTLVEQIEALQTKWRTDQTDERPENDSYYEGVYDTRHCCAEALAPILAAARAQEQELAAMKEPKNVLIDAPQSKGICVRCGKPVEVRMGQAWHTKSAGDGSSEYVWHEVCSYQDAIEKLMQQHSADLREIAEMAIASHRQYTAKALAWNGGKEPEEPTADSILAAFREKQQKAVTHSATCSKQANGIQCTCGAKKKAKVGK